MLKPQMMNLIGERLGPEVTTEAEHFYLCKACRQPVDKRDLAAVFHHEEPGHRPLPAADAERLLRISQALRATLEHR